MDDEIKQNDEELQEEKPVYHSRPKAQIILAWILLIMMVLGVIAYYYWIVYPYK